MNKVTPAKAPRAFDTTSLKGRLRALMYKKDVRQKKVADDIGVTPTAVTRWLKHNGGISWRHAEALGNYFGVPPQWIMNGGELEGFGGFSESEEAEAPDGLTAVPLSIRTPEGEWKVVEDGANAIAFPQAFFTRHGVDPVECVRVRIREAALASPIKQWDIVTLRKANDESPQGANIVAGNYYLVSIDGMTRAVRVDKTRTSLIFLGATSDQSEVFPLDGLEGISILGRVLHVEREIFI